MKPLPGVYAVHFAGDRWLSIAPDQRAMHGRTFERIELRTADMAPRTICERDQKK
jgi:hypothetical protein